MCARCGWSRGEAFGCCHRHIRAQHQSSPFIRGCRGLSALPSADELSIIDQTKYIQLPSCGGFSQIGSFQQVSVGQEEFSLEVAKLVDMCMMHLDENAFIKMSIQIKSNELESVQKNRVGNNCKFVCVLTMQCIKKMFVCLFV